jgi:subtilisin family serine protease
MQRIATRQKPGWWLVIVNVCALVLLTAGVALSQPAANDPLYGDQWALQTMGAPCAWQVTTGSSDVTVAVLDTGVDMSHPDLVGRLRTDGYDFVDDDPDPSDDVGHGTHVSGIIAATMNNAEGITGLSPNVQILPVRVLGPDGGSDAMIAAGIRYAVERGARVINMSLGAPFLVLNVAPESNQAIREAQDAGVLVVVAAGNEFLPIPNSVTVENLDAMIVAASDENDQKAIFSNSGPWVSVTAPGQDILSTMPTYEVEMTSSDLPEDQRLQQNYDYASGTSMATPYVASLAALIYSAHPDWNLEQVRSVIKQTADDSIYDNHLPHFRLLNLLGDGRIDACVAANS